MARTSKVRGRRTYALLAIVLLTGCGALEAADAPALGQAHVALGSSFSATSPLCPSTTDWKTWPQTSLSTWDDDVEPVVEWIIDRTGISSSTYAGHLPSIGRAADWRPHSREEGTKLANWFLNNTGSGGSPLGIDYIIWQAEIYLGSGSVDAMGDRGSFTENHCDHVHISFGPRGSVSFDPAKTTPWGDAAPVDAGPAADAKPAPQPVDVGLPATPSDAGASLPVTTDAASPPVDPRVAGAQTSFLIGGCAALPGAPGGPASSLWSILLLAPVVARRRRRCRATPRIDSGCGVATQSLHR